MSNARVCDSIGYSIYKFLKSKNYTGYNINIDQNDKNCMINVSINDIHPLHGTIKTTWI